MSYVFVCLLLCLQVSDEIRALQVQSQTMGTKLKNRRAAEDKLGSFVESLAVSEEIVDGIMSAEVRMGGLWSAQPSWCVDVVC